MNDEGMFWETSDEKALAGQFRKYNLAPELVTGALEGFKAKPGESMDSLAKRIEDILRKKFG